MKRFFVRFLLVIGALFVLACLGQAVPFEFAYFLLFGWLHYSLQSLAPGAGRTARPRPRPRFAWCS